MNFDDTLAYIDRIQKARTPDDVCRALIDVSSRFGMTALLAGTVPKPGTPRDEQRSHVLLSEWPKDWMEHYLAMNYVDCDPIVAYMKRSPSAVFWHDAIDGADQEAQRVCDDAAAFRLNDGFAMPVATLEGDVVIVSLGGEEVELSREATSVISLVSAFAVGRVMQLSATGPAIGRPDLTDRERECMRWAALGKSEWEISQILGISEHTSEKHLLSAKTKLGATNRVHAVAEAIRHGYIS